MLFAEPLRIIQIVVDVLEDLKIPYFIGGSLASSLHGIPRATQDIDLIADLKLNKVHALEQALHKKFYIDEDMMKNAIKRNSSFNIIHLETMFKVDVFILKKDEGSLEEMKRRKAYQISDETSQELYLASAEDIILNKLYRYKLGGEVSDRQRNDAVGVIQVQGDNLDFDYLAKRAIDFEIEELLQIILRESKLER
ncbi:nucleotidyltransferase domain-containing protein [candidate division CSSED10-310 bacterium]|uniref:Nucleotidyltransferase domain-containing protein n=1 Tax=candidate division CSSED10-310 bacterium TaxID=2855610 RepID=A0ABV6Z2L8_UNCC1